MQAHKIEPAPATIGEPHEVDADVVLGVGAPTELPSTLLARLRHRRRGAYRLVLVQDLGGYR